jgi:hypothetical protein
VEVEWDERKRIQVAERRGVDFIVAALIFEGFYLEKVDRRRDYGEVRYIALGAVDGECYVVVYTERDGVKRLITAWKGGRSDREQYEKGIVGAASRYEGTG